MAKKNPPRPPAVLSMVKIQGPLTKPAAARLAAKIRPVLKRRAFPLVISINSTGGELEAFYQLHQLLARVQPSGAEPKIITFAQCARSAAACLLVSGHRAYAQKKAYLHFHGVRYPRLQKIRSLNREKALALALRLDRENRRLALILAERILGRIVERSGLRTAQSESRADPGKFLRNYLAKVRGHLSAGASRKLLAAAGARRELIFAVAELLPLRRPPRGPAARAALDATLAQTAMAFATSDAHWASRAGTAEGWAELLMDLLLVRNLAHSPHPAAVHDLAKTFEADFLAESDRAAYEQLPAKNPQAAHVLLRQAAKPYLRNLWHLAFALGHELLSGEHTLPAADAYWLGLIDGVQENCPPFSTP